MKKISGPNPMPDQRPGQRSIRSFVLREGRITRAQQRALEELWPRYGIDAGGGALSLAEAFGREAPTFAEIGFGDGAALVHMAGRDPNANFLGIEVHRPGVGRALNRIHAAGLSNVRLLCADAVTVMRERLPAASLAGVRIFFPDPWPKKRHHKRRLVNPAFLALLDRVLAPGGVVHLATDWLPYADAMLALLDADARFVNLAGTGRFAQRPDWRPETKFERRGRRRGHPVRDLMFQKNGGDAATDRPA